MSNGKHDARELDEAFLAASPRPSQDDLIDYIADHARQLAALAIRAKRPEASALMTLAVTQLDPPA